MSVILADWCDFWWVVGRRVFGRKLEEALVKGRWCGSVGRLGRLMRRSLFGLGLEFWHIWWIVIVDLRVLNYKLKLIKILLKSEYIVCLIRIKLTKSQLSISSFLSSIIISLWILLKPDKSNNLTLSLNLLCYLPIFRLGFMRDVFKLTKRSFKLDYIKPFLGWLKILSFDRLDHG